VGAPAATAGGAHQQHRPARSRDGREPAVARKSEEEPRFSVEKLRAETEDPFTKVRIFLFGFLAVSALTGAIFIVPRLIGSAFGAPNAAPLASVLGDLATNLTAVAACGAVAYFDLQKEQARERAALEGALVARVRVLPQGDDERDQGTLKLSDLRAGRSENSRRPVLCLGDADYCLSCLSSSRSLAEAMESSDFLVVPVVTGEYGLGKSQELDEAARGVPYVALPTPGLDKKEQQDWADFIEMQQILAKEQGLDDSKGLVIIVKKNGRIGLRALGCPDWEAMTGDVAARAEAGMDTQNI